MKLVAILAFAALLVLAGAARCWWNDNTDAIAAVKVNPFALVEAVENCKDDRLIGSFVSFFLTSPHVSLIAGRFISQTSEKIGPTKDNSKIYKQNCSFLI